MAEKSRQPRRDSFWTGLVAATLLGMVIVGGLRVFGVVANRQALLDGGLTSSQLNYLVIYGVSQVIISLIGLVGMRFKPPLGVVLPWAAVLLNIFGYWAERLLFWAPDQRGGNLVFMVIWHGLWLALMAAFTIKPKVKETDGTRNRS